VSLNTTTFTRRLRLALLAAPLFALLISACTPTRRVAVTTAATTAAAPAAPVAPAAAARATSVAAATSTSPTASTTSATSAAPASTYFDAKALDLGRVLPPPPADDSAITRGEIELMLRIQAERTPDEIARARADASYSVFRFADALGSPDTFNAKDLPKTQALFRKVTREEGAVVQAGKRSFSRPRPFVLDTRIQPVLKEPTNASYPSGHALWSRVIGLLLADMLPEYRAKIMARADDFAFHRVVAGVHYPSDVEAGKLAGTALAAFLLAAPAFQADYAAAKQELRAALKLPPQP
jgi:acid phosphatase (class A)